MSAWSASTFTIAPPRPPASMRSEEHTSELQSHRDLHSFPTRRSSDLECCLTCRIRCMIWQGHVRLERQHIHDRSPASAGKHVWQHGIGQQYGAHQVGFEDVPPVVVSVLEQGL